eukprot:g30868.t1
MKEIDSLVAWCKDNNLSLNVSKTKELAIHFRKQSGEHTPDSINSAEVKSQLEKHHTDSEVVGMDHVDDGLEDMEVLWVHTQ